MLLPRVIPCLLIHNGGLVKSRLFGEYKYVGDPINAVKIFNEKKADELTVFDIDASSKNSEPNFDMIARLACECRMPLCYGGGVKTPEQAQKIIDLGVEKVSVSSGAIEDIGLISKMADAIGSQSVVAVLDVKRKKYFFKDQYEVWSHNATKKHKETIVDYVRLFQEAGAGEIVINSIDRDGLLSGYDLDLAKAVKKVCNVPLTLLGGAGTLDDISELIKSIGIVGAAAGSLFVFKGKYRAVLISYPDQNVKYSLMPF